ncbi:AAA family ATPase [Congregibacter litoralis]|uniref:GTPase subunit of restriction endonuclease n=1 Tax=Congregibacter litoralis KT71 TaxID=314285 RepID=A4AD33_9GAMM|nr:AAA family ATPase [Congregibacter litoralis]EAQ96086.1 GTPase subunit of restriction endonuclease [Congregibacter litoralis KT71]
MSFILVRLGKDSVDDIEKIDSTSIAPFTPFSIEFTCKQVEKSIPPDSYALIYLGSDNSKGIATSWEQGLRALGKITSLDLGETFNSESKLSIEIISVFDKSYGKVDFLDSQPALYSHFSEYPVIGVTSYRNNAVQKVNESRRENTSALLTALNLLFPEFSDHIGSYAPELLTKLSFVPTNKSGSADDGQGSPGIGLQAMAGSNIIFYGAPGTGKSYTIDQSVIAEFAFKTVFHAETMNADFLGSVKPTMGEDSSGSQLLTYEYMPGAFLRALTSAIENPENHYWLVIEELNRAPAAAVFGEIFQLLDRRLDGRSTYEIDFPDALCEKYVNSRLSTSIDRLYIPSNLSLYASMNSSDQGVLPLDTAFKRRWIFHYIPLDFDQGCTECDLEIVFEDNVLKVVPWRRLAEAINVLLSDIDIPEDRHLGPYFISVNDLKETERLLTGKLFMYLWDDVLRHGLRNTLFHPSVKTYGHLVTQWGDRKRIFSDALLLQLRQSLPSMENELDNAN